MEECVPSTAGLLTSGSAQHSGINNSLMVLINAHSSSSSNSRCQPDCGMIRALSLLTVLKRSVHWARVDKTVNATSAVLLVIFLQPTDN